jgi:hypothetical protein
MSPHRPMSLCSAVVRTQNDSCDVAMRHITTLQESFCLLVIVIHSDRPYYNFLFSKRAK